MRDTVLKFVTMPMAIKIFKDDKEGFAKSKVSGLYLDLIDGVLLQLQNDFNNLKKDMYTKHHLDVRRVSGLKYTINKEVIEFTPEEMRGKTKEIMQEYLATVEFERQQRPIYQKKPRVSSPGPFFCLFYF